MSDHEDANDTVTEMRLCESSRLVLRPGQLYRFSIAPGCDLCRWEASACEGDPIADLGERPNSEHDIRTTPRAVAVLVSLRRGPMTTLQIRNSIGDEITEETRKLLECMSVDLIWRPAGDSRWSLTRDGVAWLQRRGLNVVATHGEGKKVTTMPTQKWISWKDRDGNLHCRDDIPSDAECLSLGALCSLCPYTPGRAMAMPGHVLAIGSITVVCSRGEHAMPPRIVVYVDDTRREVKICDRG